MASPAVMKSEGALEPGYRAPTCESTGPVRSLLFQPDGYSLWELEAVLGAGAELRWDGHHGDEVVYVLEGELDVGGWRGGPKAVVVVESGVAATARATVDTRILHFAPASVEPPATGVHGAPAPAGHGVHLIGAADARLLGDEAGSGARLYADSTCPTCRTYLLEVFASGPRVVSSHHHSEDEIIRVLEGELKLGRTTLAAGESIAVPARYRYGFRASGPSTFLTYRRDAALYVGAPGGKPTSAGDE